jgi:ergothioneine biosynthesis protein EgtB
MSVRGSPTASRVPAAAADCNNSEERASWSDRFATVRANSCALAANLSPEDQTIQTIPDVSPTKWHLAHTTWFFETFLLTPFLESYRPFDSRFGYLFNSYYEAAGARHPRAERGLLSRPDVKTIAAYRQHVDTAMQQLIASVSEQQWPKLCDLIELGLNHEEQHQELILMDIKHVFSVNPLQPVYADARPACDCAPLALAWSAHPGGLYEIGHTGLGFAFDNEGPRHKLWLQPFALANRAVTVAEYLRFIGEGGYQRAELWLADGWAIVEAKGWTAPLYWNLDDAKRWTMFTLSGPRPLQLNEPVCHVSYYEADAFARWAGKRLPSEAEWEVAASLMRDHHAPEVHFVDSNVFHPRAAQSGEGLQQMFGDVWEWTQSPYVAYPRFKPASGAMGEYNGKFMSGQMVLRGGSAVTPPGHIRATYRNFFPPHYRVVFGGIRLADDV